MSFCLMKVNEFPWSFVARSTPLLQGEVHVWHSTLEESIPALHVLSKTLSSDETARALRFRRDETRLEFTLGRGLLRLLLGAYLGADPAALQLTCGLHGKPELAASQASGSSKKDSVQFNVSHSNGRVLHAFCLNRAVGVDIEMVRPTVPGLNIARRFFTHREAAALSAEASVLQPHSFSVFWTRKEALMKARGDGLSGNWGSAEVPHPGSGPEMLLEAPARGGGTQAWSLFDLDVGQNFVASLAVEGSGWNVSLREWRTTGQTLNSADQTAKKAISGFNSGVAARP
jgi:4'-phosphopantetheinyl transferase